jgi:predicted amidohydrolase
MKVVLCQLELVWEDPEANYGKVRELLADRCDLEGSLIVLPEMLATGFSMDVAVVGAGEPGRTQGFLAQLARTHRATVLGGFGVPPSDRGAGAGEGRGRNVALAVDPAGEEIAEYTKIHPFTHGGEGEHYEAGEAVVKFDWGNVSVCPLICYDLRFPEVFRAGAGLGAEIFCVIANWPIKRVGHWVTLLQARAIENQAYVVGVNRCGSDPSLTYPGRSLVVDPHGVIIADASDREMALACDLDPEVVRNWRREFPALADRRIL